MTEEPLDPLASAPEPEAHEPPAPQPVDAADLGFSYRVRKSGDVELLHHGRLAATLRGRQGQLFGKKAESLSEADLQQWMARLTGNYRRGNERRAGCHPRNRG